MRAHRAPALRAARRGRVPLLWGVTATSNPHFGPLLWRSKSPATGVQSRTPSPLERTLSGPRSLLLGAPPAAARRRSRPPPRCQRFAASDRDCYAAVAVKARRRRARLSTRARRDCRCARVVITVLPRALCKRAYDDGSRRLPPCILRMASRDKIDFAAARTFKVLGSIQSLATSTRQRQCV